jgi:hypothetical protein
MSSQKSIVPKLREITADNLRDHAILVKFTRREWNPNKLDRGVSDELKELKSASSDVRVYKSLVSSQWLSGWRSDATAAYNYFLTHTLPWEDRGYRVLPMSAYLDFVDFMAETILRLNEKADLMAEMFSSAIDQAENQMGDLFNRSEYPTKELFREKFEVDWAERPVPVADDFRLKDMNEAMIDRMQTKLEEMVTRSIGDALQEPWTRMQDAIKRISDKVSRGDGFQYTALTNLAQLVDALPGLNLTNDPHLTEIIEDTKKLLNDLDGELKPHHDRLENKKAAERASKALRKDEDVRAHAADETKKILDKMSAFMGAS